MLKIIAVIVGIFILMVIYFMIFPRSNKSNEQIGVDSVVSSLIRGQLVDEQENPIEGAQIIRQWKWVWPNKSGEDRTVTDAEGRFVLNEVRRSSFRAVVPHEPNIQIEVFYQLSDKQSDRVLLLGMNKSGYEPNSEVKKVRSTSKEIDLICTAGTEANADGFYWGSCRLRE